MPTFRQPEWQQPADRHTEIVDPVLTVRQLSRFEFNLKSYVRIDHALVFATGKGGYVAYLPPQRPTRGDIAANRYTAVYEVDMGVHPHTCDLTLPSDNDAFEFTAAVDLSWQVLDPVRFVASGHRNVPGLLLGELQQAARPVTRRFAIADSASAEVELLERMNLLGPLGAPAGLQVTWTLRLKRDEANIEHELRKQAIEHSADEQIRAAQRGMDIDVEVDRRYRQSDSLQLDRAMQYGTHQQELLLQQQRWQHAQALLAGQQQLELQRLEAQKIEFYQFHLQQGGVHQWALHLAQHPEDSHMVMNSMREDQLRMIQAQMELVQQLLNGDTAENWELEGPKQLALRTVNDILTQRLPGVPQNPPPPLPPGAGPEYPGTVLPGEPVAPPPTGTGPYAPGQGGAPGAYGAGPGAAPGAYAGGPGAAPGAYGGAQTSAPGGYVPGQLPAAGAYVPGQAPGAYQPGQSAETGPYGPGRGPVPGPHGPGQPAAGPYGPGHSPATGPSAPGQGPASGAYPGGPNPNDPYPGGPQPGAPTAGPGTAAGAFPGAPGHPVSGRSPVQAGPTGPATPTGPVQPTAPPGVAPYPQGPAAGMPASTPYGSPPAGYTPQDPYPGAPTQPPASSPAAPPQPPGQHAGPESASLSKAPADQPPTSQPSSPAPAATSENSAWQPPPGYGRTPTLPAQNLPEVVAGSAEEEGVEEADGPEGGGS
ncbi:hypothetical protein AB0I51_08460 [Streptomyces sp. NPDC050549]|uniref:hypothetical protein n=1 Tax=Streptomyces sp. NPDC050549 TaxID=3155406 RepID=UPI003418CF6A